MLSTSPPSLPYTASFSTDGLSIGAFSVGDFVNIFDNQSSLLYYGSIATLALNAGATAYEITVDLTSTSGTRSSSLTAGDTKQWSMHLTGQQGSGSGSGSGLAGTELELVRNIGLNAWIDGATGTSSYNQNSRVLNYPMTLKGNSVRYDLTFDYTGTGCIANSTAFTYNSTALFNNYITGIAQSPNRIINPSFTLQTVAAGNYEIPVTISTQYAGGVGNGSSYTVNIPVQITAADNMGNPVITYATATLTITSQNTVTVSGIQYYGPGSYVRIPSNWLNFTNFYNIVHNPSLINYVQFGGVAVAGEADVVGNLGYGPSYTPYNRSTNNPPEGTNPSFGNRNAFDITVEDAGAITMTVTNNRGGTATRNPFFPVSGQTNTGVQTAIGYLDSAPNETAGTIVKNTPPQAGVDTISGLTSFTRVSIKSATTNGTATDRPDTTSAIQNFSSATLTDYDVQYNPYTGNLHATNQASALASTYLLVAETAMPAPTNRKYLTLKVAVTAILKNFTIKLGSTAATDNNITNVWVKWEDTANNITSWYDASVAYDAGGCQAGSATNKKTVWGIQINSAVDSTYTNASFIYINVLFTDKIKLSEINIV